MPTIPAGLEPFMLSGSYAITALLAVAIWWASGRAGLSSAQRAAAWLVAMAVLVSWQLLGERLARAGVFINEPDRLGPWTGVAVVLPVIIGLAGIAASPTARRIVDATPLWALVAIQFYRVPRRGLPRPVGRPPSAWHVRAARRSRRCRHWSCSTDHRLHDSALAGQATQCRVVERVRHRRSRGRGHHRVPDLAWCRTDVRSRRAQPVDHRVSSGSGAALRSAGLVDLARPRLATARRSHSRCDRPSPGRVKDCYIGILSPDAVRRHQPRTASGHSRPMRSVPVPINVRCYSECVAKVSCFLRLDRI